MLKEIRASQVTVPGMIVLAMCYAFLTFLEICVFAPSKAGLWNMGNLAIIGYYVIITLYWFLVVPVTTSSDGYSYYYLIDETTEKATRAPRGLYFRSFDGWFRKKGQILIRFPLWPIQHTLNEKHGAYVTICSPHKSEPCYAQMLYLLCRDLDAVRNGSTDEIIKAYRPYDQIASLHIRSSTTPV